MQIGRAELDQTTRLIDKIIRSIHFKDRANENMMAGKSMVMVAQAYAAEAALLDMAVHGKRRGCSRAYLGTSSFNEQFITCPYCIYINTNFERFERETRSKRDSANYGISR